MGLVLKLVLVATSGLFFGAVALGAIGVFLVVNGSPGTCGGREITPISAAVAAQLDQRWDQFSLDILSAGTSISISESEATSRGRQYVDDEDVPVDNLRVYFCSDGRGQVAGEVEALGIDVDFVITGRLDVSGPEPVVELESVNVGNLPEFVGDAVLDVLLDDGARTLELDENLAGSEISDGVIVVTGVP